MLRAHEAGKSQVKNFWIGLTDTFYQKNYCIGKSQMTPTKA